MASLTKYAGTVTQTTGMYYASFTDLANIKNGTSGSFAVTETIQGRDSHPNRPATVSCTNFGFNLPTGAEVTSVVVQYGHQKVGSPSIPGPTVTLLGVSGKSGKGSAPSTSAAASTKTFTGLTRTQVNSSSFGVRFGWDANVGSGTGVFRLYYVRIVVNYKVPSYSLTLKKASGGYNEESYTVEASISNTNLTSYNPSCTLTAPTGFSFTDFAGTGEYTKVSPTVLSWNPKFTSKVASSTASFKFDVDVTYPSGQSSYTGTFTLSESLYSTTKNFTATITERPPTPSDEGDTGEKGEYIDGDSSKYKEILTVTEDEIFALDIDLNSINWETDDLEISSWVDTGDWYSFNEETFDPNAQSGGVNYRKTPQDNWSLLPVTITPSDLDEDNKIKYEFKVSSFNKSWYNIYKGEYTLNHGHFVIEFKSFDSSTLETTNFHKFLRVQVNPKDESLTIPNFSLLEPSEEELNRLGDGFTYIAQADIKHTTTDTTGRDWYKNNRIGVFNNALFSDDGTSASHNDMWTVTNGTMTRESTYTRLVESTNPLMCQLNSAYITPYSVVEFDICQVDGLTNYAPLYVRNSAGNSSLSYLTYRDLGAEVGDWVHIKIVFNDTDTITIYASTLAEPITKTLSSTDTAYRILFYGGEASTELHFKNFKIGSDNPTLQEMFSTAEYWSKATAGLNEYENCECEFTYNENYPLYVIMTGDYPEAEDYGYDMGTIKYDTPAIIEKQVYNSREPSGNYPLPIEALLTGEDIATLQLAKDQTSQGVVLYDFPVDETVSTNDRLAIRGLQVRANIEATDNLVIQAKLHSPNGEVGNRSILVDSQDEEIVIGGLGDLWGFTTLQMTHLELWQLELSVANILSQSDSSILFNNVEIIFYLETVEKQEITIRVEDEDIAYYGAFIETVKIPEGLNTDTSFLSIDGTDTNDAYRQNIREKTITIEFNLSNCELQTSTDMLRQLTKLFVNEKDQYNRPIPKKIQFSHYPNDYFEYIMEEPFDVDTEITDHTIKAQLTVPSGTSYSLYDTVTNTTGNANGLAAVNPIITVRPSDVNIQVSETNTGQVFQIAYTGDWNDHTVEIDCEDRKVYLIKGEDERIDISKYADYNSDWFRLDGEYEFSSVNCTILSVIFNERW